MTDPRSARSLSLLLLSLPLALPSAALATPVPRTPAFVPAQDGEVDAGSASDADDPDADDLELDPEDAADEGPALDPEAERTITKFRAYLLRRPYHHSAFEHLVDAAVEAGWLDPLVAEVEAEVEALTDESPAAEAEARRVLLARLYARTQRAVEALALLEGLTSEDAELDLLRGEMLLAEGRPEEGLAALDAAAGRSEDRAVLERLHRRRGEALLEAGERERAAAAYRDLAALDPGDYSLRVEVAGALARAGLLDAAAEEYAAAAELAGGDAPRLCRVLADAGRLAERQGDVDGALERYGRAVDLLGRGHWLKRELLSRVLAAHVRGGTLEDLASELEARVAAEPADLDRRELLARARVELRQLDAARAVLAAAAEDFPADLDLGRALLEVLERVGDDDARVREYQRLIDQHPRELELYVELGQVLAVGGQLEQARVQWERSLEARLDDPNLCLRLAELHTHYDLHEEALELVQRARELSPEDLSLVGDLCGALDRAGRPDEVPAALEAAREAAGDDPLRLEQYANLVRGHGDADEALAALDLALAADPEAARLLRAQAELRAEVGDDAGARASLRRLVEVEQDTAARRDAARRLVRHALRMEGLKDFVEAEEARMDAAGADTAGQLLVALAETELGREGRARAAFERLVELDPGDELARSALADLHLALGRADLAEEQYRALIDLRPRQRARWLQEIAQVQEEDGEEQAARATWEEVLRHQTRTPAALREAARALVRLDRSERAAELLREAVRLAPEDADLRLALAEVYEDLERYDQVREEVRTATEVASRDLQDRARERWYELLLDEDGVEGEIARLREAIDANPYDEQLPLALVDLYERELEYTLALDLIDELLAYRPRDVALLDRRAGLHVEMSRWEAALADLEALAELPDTEGLDLTTRIADAYLALGDRDAAGRVLVELGDPARVADVYHRAGLGGEAREQLERALAARPEDRKLLRRLSLYCRTAGDLDGALEALQRLIAIEGDDDRLLNELAALHLQRGDDEAMMDVLARRIADVVEPAVDDSLDEKERRAALRRANARLNRRLNELRDFFWQNQMWQQEGRAYVALARRYPASPLLVDRAVTHLIGESRGDDVLQLLADTRAATLEQGRLPAGYDEARWKRQLDRREDHAWRNVPELAARRAERLAERTDELDEDEVQELMRVYVEQGRFSELLPLLEGAAERFERRRDRYLGGVAMTLFEMGEDEALVARLRELRELQADELPRERRMTRSYGKRLRRNLPEDLEATLTDEQIERHWRLSTRSTLSDTWAVGASPDLPEVELALSSALGRLGRVDEAREVAVRWLPEDRDQVQARSWMAEHLRRIGADEAAETLEAECWAVLEDVAADPVLRHDRTWSDDVRRVVDRHIARLRDGGEGNAAWELTVRWHGPQKARALLSGDELEAVREARRAAWEAALAASPEGELDSDAHDALCLHAILLVDAADWEELARVLGQAEAQGLQGPDLMLQLARLEARAGRPEAAVTRLRAAAEAAEAEVRESGQVPPAGMNAMAMMSDDEVPDPYVLELPSIDVAGQDPGGAFGEMLQALGWGMPQLPPDKWISVPHRVELARLAWNQGDYETVTEEVARIRERAPNVFSYARYELVRAVEGVDDRAPLVGLLELLYEEGPTDGQVVEAYGEALVEAGRGEDAQRVYTKFLRAADRDTYRYREIEAAHGRLTGAPEEARKTLPELREAVAADPRNARLRLALVQALRAERAYAEAAEHALEAERLAPHLDEVREQALELSLVVGDVEGYRERLLRERQQTQDKERKLELSYTLASMAWDRGDEALARELLKEGLRAQGPNVTFSAANFFLERGRRDLAREALTDEIEHVRNSSQSWYLDQLEDAAARMALDDGDARGYLETTWERMERNGEPGLSWEDLQLLEQALQQAKAPDELADSLEGTVDELTGDLGVLARVVLARLREDHAEEERLLLEHALAHAPQKELGLQAVARAREREDWAAARAHLEALAEAYRPSPRRMVEEQDPPLSEHDLYVAERGSLLYAEGRTEEALEVWRSGLERSDRGDEVLLRLFVERRLDDEVLALLDAPAGPGATAALDPEGELLRAAVAWRSEDPGAALEHLTRALPDTSEMQGGPSSRVIAVRDQMERCHRELGTLDAFRQRLRADLGRAAEDADAAVRLVELTLELDGYEAAMAEAEGLTGRQHSMVQVYEAVERLARDHDDPERVVQVGTRLAGLRKELGWSGYQDTMLTEALWDLGRREDALEAVRSRFEDPESDDAWQAAGYHLRERDDWEGVLDALARMSPEARARQDGLRRDALEKLGRTGELALLLVERAGNWQSFPPEWDPKWARRFLGEAEVEQALAAVEEAPEDPERLARAVNLLHVLGEPEACRAMLERLAAVRPASLLVHGLRWKVLEAAGDLDGAVASVDDALDVARRLSAAGEPSMTENHLLRHRARLRLLRDGVEGARAAWEGDLRSPYGDVEMGTYQIWSLGQLRRWNDPALEFFAASEDPEGFLARARELDPESLRFGVAGNGALAEARFRLGEREAAFEELLREQATDASSYSTLLRLARELGWEERLLERVRAEGDLLGLPRDLERRVLRDLDRPAEAAALLVEREPDWADDPGLRVELAELRVEAGELQAAWDALGEPEDAPADLGVVFGAEELRAFAPLRGAGSLRFAFGQASVGGVGGLAVGSVFLSSGFAGPTGIVSGRRPVSDPARRQLRAFLARALDRPEADALEAEVLEQLTRDGEGPSHALERLGAYHCARGARESGRALLARAREAAHEEGRSFRDACWNQVARALRQDRGDEAREWADAYLEELARDLEDPVKRAWHPVRLQTRLLFDAEACAAAVDTARALDPDGFEDLALTDRGWVALLAGDAAGAEALFRREFERRRLELQARGHASAELRLGLGLALAELGRTDEARAELRRGLAEHPASVLADRARAALGE